MKNRSWKYRLLAGTWASVALFVAYLICGHVFLYLHGMGQWPIILLVFGLIVIAIAVLAGSRKVMIGVVAGYLIGFVLMELFGATYYMSVGLMPDGSELLVPQHNGWRIWTLSYLSIILLSFLPIPPLQRQL